MIVQHSRTAKQKGDSWVSEAVIERTSNGGSKRRQVIRSTDSSVGQPCDFPLPGGIQ